ncbi:unnamed protein product [Peronospora farinosa]|uniref:Kinesin motor domain-containing protein n=1 Tax=Peronospora farinosa TaxID=134698 RepID=A0AAV0U6D6_9STRA|nr:unnamed protein product [Peronospora farinosa]CAI5732470.1 unnamed protein product [Peronospora farinosa]
MTDDDAASVRVAVRIRPLIGREKVDRCDECVSVLEEENQIVMGKNRAFTYDYVFSKYAQQSDIWRCVDPLIRATFDGYNSTIFAYGQTGSGKTYTMGSGSSVHIPPEDYGIIPRVISYMFDQIDTKIRENQHYKAELKIRFLEIYGEEIHDLLVTLGDSTGESKVSLREAENGEVQVTGASEVQVVESDECMRLLERGTLCRTTGSTLMNAHSSRSHAIFTVTMVQHVPIGDLPADGRAMEEGDYETRNSYFNFVDLAGSERQKRTQAEGKRLKEGIDINKGLLALGNVISALGDDKKRGKVHVPYRDSKLTRMLQDSLGGNSRTLMLTCVSPADVNFEETLNALKYANRARNIQNKPVVNRDEASAMTMELRRQIEMLQMEVHRLRNPGLSESELKMTTVGTNFIGMANDFDSFGNLQTRAENAENEVARLTAELKRGKTQLDHLKEEMIAAQAERDYLRLCVEEGTGGSSVSSDERESKCNVLKDQLRIIYELQEKLRATERDRDNVMMNFPGSTTNANSSGARPSAAAAFVLPSLAEVDTKVGSELLQRAEKEIERETALLNKLKEGESGDDAGGNSEGSEDGNDGNDSADGMEAEEENQEEAGRMRVFQRRQRHLGESVQDLAHDISLKEQLVQNIRQAQENYDRMKSFYEQKMAEMVEEMHTAQVDRDRLVEEIQQIEKKAAAGGDTSGENGRLTKLSRDLKLKEEELHALRKKQNDISCFMSQKKKNEMQLRVLNSEISNMKRQKVDLVKKIQEERKRYEEEAKQRRREIMSLKRTQQRDKQHILRLGSQKDAQERVLKRKMEEVTAAKQRLKHQQQLTAQARKMNSGRKKKPGMNRSDHDAKWLSEEVKKRAEEQQKLEQLQKEREAVAQEMEALYVQRDMLEREVKNSISSRTNIRDVLTSPMQSMAPPSRLDSGREDQQLNLAEEQLLYDLEERIEACQAQLEYKEEKIFEISDDVRVVDGSNALTKIETTQSLPEARTLLKMLFSMAVDVKKQDQQREQELAKQQVEMADLVRHLEQEREKTAQIKQSYEESLQRVVNGGTSLDGSSSAQEPLDERSRILLSVSEERNSVLRKKCEELERVSSRRDREKQLMEDRLQQEQLDLAASRDRVRYLETKLRKLSAVAVVASQKPGRSQIPVSSSIGNKFAAVSRQTQSGQTSWINESDGDDEYMGDEPDDEHEQDGNEDVLMQSDDDDNAQISRTVGQARRRFRMESENVGGSNLDLASMSLQKSSALLRNGSEEYGLHGDDRDDATSPHMGSDDSSATSKSIFSRLSNPTNFTGIHKNRVQESVSKREILQSRSERNRSRRLKDKGQRKLPRSFNAPTEQFVGTPAGLKNLPSIKSNSVLQVLANMKRENESEQYVSSSSGLRQPMSYVTTDRPPPQGDVYSRLAGQYTASAKNKRHHVNTAVRREKGGEAKGLGKDKLHGIDVKENVYVVDQHGGSEDANYTGSEDERSYDPLLGGDSLIKQVHDSYQERIAQRNADV